MQEASTSPSMQQAMPFGEFLAVLLQALGNNDVHPCILRNYEEFPANNIGNDVDIFISPSQLPNAIRAIRSIAGIRVVGYAERYYVAHTFLEGIATKSRSRALPVDFIQSFIWKGLPFLDTDAVLQSAILRQTDSLSFLTPSPLHEAIISLLSSLLLGGWLKEKYFLRVQATFHAERTQTIAALTPGFGAKTATRLVDAVIKGERGQILNCVRPLRFSLAARSLLRNPYRSVLAAARHYAREFAFGFLPHNLETVCILGPDEHLCAQVAAGLAPMLQSTAKTVEQRPLCLRILPPRECASASAPSATHHTANDHSHESFLIIARWLGREWASRFTRKKNLTLRIREVQCHRLLVDTHRNDNKIPAWFVRLVTRLLPPADLWILLDTGADGLRAKEGKVHTTERLPQRESYLAFLRTRSRHVILNANQPVDCTIENAYAAIIEELTERTSDKLRKRFS